jgi:hypothetical protein
MKKKSTQSQTGRIGPIWDHFRLYCSCGGVITLGAAQRHFHFSGFLGWPAIVDLGGLVTPPAFWEGPGPPGAAQTQNSMISGRPKNLEKSENVTEQRQV